MLRMLCEPNFCFSFCGRVIAAIVWPQRRKEQKKMNTDDLIKTACSLFGDPYDDRESSTSPHGQFLSPHGQKPEHVSLRTVAEQMEISVVKVYIPES